jgi:hypothetical protein
MLYPLSLGASTGKLEEVYLSKGEQIELKIKGFASFSIGNKEVIHSKFYAAQSKLLVKGNSMGFSDIVVWRKNGSKIIYNVYVVSKREQLKFSQIANDFKQIGLQTQLTNKKIIVNGLIKTPFSLILYKEFISQYKNDVISFVGLEISFVKKQIVLIYQDLGPKLEKIECSRSIQNINCFVSPYNSKESYNSKYAHINFSHFPQNYKNKNFEVLISIYKLTFAKGEQSSLGAYQASASVQELSSNPKNLIDNNLFRLSNQQAKSQLLAKPKFVTSIGSKQSLQLGSDIPYTTSSQTQTNTEWIFAGLKIETLLEVDEGKIKLTNKTQVTSPGDKSIQGGKSTSQVFLTPGKEQLLFDINYESVLNQSKSFPILGKIPLLKRLFISDEDSSTNSELIAYITIKEI